MFMKPPCDEAVIRSVSADAPCAAKVGPWILAAARMDAAQNGGDPGMFLDETDALVEVRAAEQDVVEHGGHVRRSQ
jgi:hypothetical protein